jgi:predicted metal-dependent phosphotriesterase family hydrolase
VASSWTECRQVTVSVIRTLDGDLEPTRIGFTLGHEHVYSDFAVASGDPDLDFTDEAAIARELAAARADGAEALVEMSTYDMGCSPTRVAELCAAADLVGVKSTGWFRSPFLDVFIEDKDPDALVERLVDDIQHGFKGCAFRAGLIGEVGMRNDSPSRAERVALDAAAAAAVETGVGIAAHTDNWANACSVLGYLTECGVRHDRIMLAHARCADPLEGQRELLRAGVTLAFDQLGHLERDPVALVADRLAQLVEAGFASRLVVSADVGRRSRLLSAGGSGYISGVRSLLRELDARSLDPGAVHGLTHDAIGRFLAFDPEAEAQ